MLDEMAELSAKATKQQAATWWENGGISGVGWGENSQEREQQMQRTWAGVEHIPFAPRLQ